MDEREWVNIALQCGAAKAALIRGGDIVLSREFRTICERNTCGMYDRCYMCPPSVGEIEPLMAKVRRYSIGLLYQTISRLEDSYDIEGMTEAAEYHARCTQRVHERAKALLPDGFLHLAAGGCHLCASCAKREGQPCRFPAKALPSMESYGIDVYQLTTKTPLRYVNGQNTVTYFSLVLWKDQKNADAVD